MNAARACAPVESRLPDLAEACRLFFANKFVFLDRDNVGWVEFKGQGSRVFSLHVHMKAGEMHEFSMIDQGEQVSDAPQPRFPGSLSTALQDTAEELGECR